jgi:hypothetical protein
MRGASTDPLALAWEKARRPDGVPRRFGRSGCRWWARRDVTEASAREREARSRIDRIGPREPYVGSGGAIGSVTSIALAGLALRSDRPLDPSDRSAAPFRSVHPSLPFGRADRSERSGRPLPSAIASAPIGAGDRLARSGWPLASARATTASGRAGRSKRSPERSMRSTAPLGWLSRSRRPAASWACAGRARSSRARP